MASTSKLAMFSFIAEVVVRFAIVFMFYHYGRKNQRIQHSYLENLSSYPII